LFAIALLVSLSLLLLWAAGVDWQSPIFAQQQRNWTGSEFRVVMGGAAQDEDRLNIGAVGDDRTALQSVVLNGVDAAQNTILRYHFSQFPHTLELSLVFRRVGDEDVTVVSLPWPRDGDSWFDLGTVPEWRGRITELAFAEYPTPQIVPPMQGFKPFTLVGASLYSRSWQGDLSALVTDWTGQWPWSQRSVHALGRDTDTPRAQSLILCVMLAVGLILFWSFVILRMRGAALLPVGVVALFVGWTMLDLQWHSGLRWRHSATEVLYSGFSWPERELHSADQDLVETARELKLALRDVPENTRVLVHSASSFTVLRLVYHLLPMNVGVLAQARATAPDQPLPEGSIVVLYDTAGWRYDSQRKIMHGDGLRLPGEIILRRDPLIVFQVGEGS
jgi:hypothetical protein